MGVFEYSPEKGRIHFHMLAYIPDGQMLGRITEKQSYSPQEGRMKTRHENDFFAAAFGVNDFEEIDGSPRAYRRAVEYILKYVEKQSERIVYSRGIMTAFCRKLIGLSSRWLGGLGSIRRTDKLHPFGGRHYDVFPVGQSCHLLSGLSLIERARSRGKP